LAGKENKKLENRCVAFLFNFKLTTLSEQDAEHGCSMETEVAGGASARLDLREFDGLPLSQSSSPCSSQTTSTTTTTAGGLLASTPPPRDSLSIAGTPTILVPASPDSRGDHLDPLNRFSIDEGRAGGCLAGQKRRQLTARLMDLRFDAKDDDVFQQDHKKSHKKAKVEHQVRAHSSHHKHRHMATTNIVMSPPRSSRLCTAFHHVVQQLPESASQCTICLDSWQSSGPHKYAHNTRLLASLAAASLQLTRCVVL
jgi:hypothetical protein